MVGITRALIFGDHHPRHAISMTVNLLALPIKSAKCLGTRIAPLLTSLRGNAQALLHIDPSTLKYGVFKR